MKNFFKIFKSNKPDWLELPQPDDSIDYFLKIKKISDQYWSDLSINNTIYGFQVQFDSKWRSGLSEEQINNFENEVGIPFPTSLRNYYKSMNGLTKPGINVFASDGNIPAYHPIYYSYPDDIKIILEMIAWIYDENKVNKEILAQNNISRIFPITGHRLMLIDIPGNPILSMYGDDIIYYAENLSKFLANDIFHNINNVYDFESGPDNEPKIKFWLDDK